MRKKSTTAVAMTAITISMLLMTAAQAVAQDGVRYTGKTLSNPNRDDGGLSPAVGVHNIHLRATDRAGHTTTSR